MSAIVERLGTVSYASLPGFARLVVGPVDPEDHDEHARTRRDSERRVRDRRRRMESVAKSMTRSALLMGQAEGLVAAWERIIDAGATPAARPASFERPDPAVLVAELERDLHDLERQVADLRREAAEETTLAADWERRAEAAARDGRHDLVQQARDRQRTHAEYAAAIGVEANALDDAREWYRNKVSALRAAAAPRNPPSTAEVQRPE